MNTDLKRKLASLIATRALVSTLLLGGATVMQVKAPGSFPVDPFFLLIALTYALTIVYAVTLHLVDRYRWLIDLQLACDAIVVSAFISLTGGITSLFSLLYVLPIVAGSMVGCAAKLTRIATGLPAGSSNRMTASSRSLGFGSILV